MTFIDRFTDTGFEAAQLALAERRQQLLDRIAALPEEVVLPANWSDDEIAAEQALPQPA